MAQLTTCRYEHVQTRKVYEMSINFLFTIEFYVLAWFQKLYEHMERFCFRNPQKFSLSKIIRSARYHHLEAAVWRHNLGNATMDGRRARLTLESFLWQSLVVSRPGKGYRAVAAPRLSRHHLNERPWWVTSIKPAIIAEICFNDPQKHVHVPFL